MTVYFDNSATTKVCEEAAEAVRDAMLYNYGNPSSTHHMGRAARDILAKARGNVADALGASPEEIFFTSGGTEADNWALTGAGRLLRHKGNHIITTAAEHDAVLNTAKELEAQGCSVTYIKPDKTGRVSVDSVMAELRPETVLVSVMLVNNETGAVNPVSEIARAVKEKNPYTLIHTDAVQGLLKIPFSAKTLGADLISVSSHKIHGPKGAGTLYIKGKMRFPALIAGGGQEGGYRSGTEALPVIAGFGAAAEAGRKTFDKNFTFAKEYRSYIIEKITAALPAAVIIGEGDCPNIICLSLPGYRSEVLMNFLDADGICVSKGSACKRGARSHVLEAMGLPNDVIDGAIRLSFSGMNTPEEADYFISSLLKAAGSIRKVLR